MLDIVTQPIIQWPEYGGAVNSETTDLVLGGMALNTAVSIAKIGKTPVGLISCLGHDVGGQVLTKGLTELNIDISHMCYTDKANTGNAICFIHPGGERSFVLCMAANNYLGEDNVDFDALEEGDYLHIGGAMIMDQTKGEDLACILKRAKERKVTISVDTCWDGTNQWASILAPCLPYCDIFFTNQEEGILYSGKKTLEEALAYYASFGPQVIVVKMGKQGAYIQSEEFTGLEPIFKVDTVDATGAGDAFDAGFLIGMFNHWPMEQSAVFASAVGAKCVTAFGATTGVAGYGETLQLIKSQSRAGDWNWGL
jgi:sugar/nucleoside kinase (ribokinase family)